MLQQNKEKGVSYWLTHLAIALVALVITGLFFGNANTALAENKLAVVANSTTVSVNTDGAIATPEVDVDLRLHRAEFMAFQNECGNVMDRRSIAPLAKDDRSDFVLRGEGNALSSFTDVRCTLATNPTVAFMVATGLQNQKMPSGGETIGDLNSDWLPLFIDQSSTEQGLLVWVNIDSEGEGHVTPAYQGYAFRVWSILNQFKNNGITDAKAITHYPLQSMVTGIPKTFEEKRPYNGQFIELVYALKGHDCPFMRIGFNTSDGRFAILDNTCDKPTPSATPKKFNPPKVTPAKPTPPKDTPKQPTPPKDTPKPKNPALDPVNNDNAGNGGGKNADPGPGKYIAPEKMERPTSEVKTEPTAPAAPKSKPVEKKSAPASKHEQKSIPSVDPASQINDGVVPTKPSSEDTCNPDFQDC